MQGFSGRRSPHIFARSGRTKRARSPHRASSSARCRILESSQKRRHSAEGRWRSCGAFFVETTKMRLRRPVTWRSRSEHKAITPRPLIPGAKSSSKRPACSARNTKNEDTLISASNMAFSISLCDQKMKAGQLLRDTLAPTWHALGVSTHELARRVLQDLRVLGLLTPYPTG